MKRLLLALILCCASARAEMPFITRTTLVGSTIERVTIPWTSESDGTQTGELTISGVLLRVVTDPGTPAPTASYTAKLLDANGLDLFSDLGNANRSATATEHFCPGVVLNDGTTTSVFPIACSGVVTPTISGAGSGKNGTIVLYIKK